ncbi:hypothetical protein [Oscillibacter sp.]|uniref:hypothetical protein n=1 Tax=Oscillibacter sp. TaxID=1945593 RepID=UPI002631E90C|nr:hypothetical protein [Oscillibacter sp.]MDD3347875.1 hypothetical protein [Oscillibacter sp.]
MKPTILIWGEETQYENYQRAIALAGGETWLTKNASRRTNATPFYCRVAEMWSRGAMGV